MSRLFFCIGIVCLILSGVAYADDWNAARDFAQANPNGAWSYIWQIGIPPVMNDVALFNQFDDFGNGMVRWVRVDEGWWRGDVWKNVTSAPVDFVSSWFEAGSIAIDPGTGHAPLSFWPGASVRWTAPKTGRYQIDCQFKGISYANTGVGVTSNVYVKLNTGAYLYGAELRGFVGGGSYAAITPETALKSYNDTMVLNQGQYVDFMVWGTGNNNYGDTTGLDAIVTAVPEPCSMIAMLVMGSGLAAGMIRRRK